MLQWEDFFINKKKRHLLSKVMRLFWSRNIKGIFFKNFFPFSSLTKGENHCCSILSNIYCCKIVTSIAYCKQNHAGKPFCNHVIGNQRAQLFSSQYASINSSNAVRHIPYLFKIGSNFLPITAVGWRSHIFKQCFPEHITNVIDYSIDWKAIDC